MSLSRKDASDSDNLGDKQAELITAQNASLEADKERGETPRKRKKEEINIFLLKRTKERKKS